MRPYESVGREAHRISADAIIMRLQPVHILEGLALVGLLFVGGGCAGGATAQPDDASVSPPGWFAAPNQAYPDDQYLVAVAKGPSPQAAQDRAFGNLARIFEADIQASQSLLDRYEEVTDDGEGREGEGRTLIVTRSDVESDETLRNTEVLAQEQVGSSHYALVGMERAETLRIYTQQIDANRAEIEQYRAAARRAEAPLPTLAYLQQARVVATVNERLEQQRRIIGGGAGTVDRSGVRTDLDSALRAARIRCPVAVQGDDVPPPIEAQVRATIEDRGFRVTSRRGDAALVTHVSFTTRPTLTSRDDAHFVRWTLSIEVKDPRRNQVLRTFTTQERSGALSKASVARRAHQRARTVIDEQFSTFLDRMLLRVDSS